MPLRMAAKKHQVDVSVSRLMMNVATSAPTSTTPINLAFSMLEMKNGSTEAVTMSP